jgi:Domain of unknown function (DUF1911)/Domain of unknown function (DUF1910)
MVRQKIKTEEYFKDYLISYKSHIERGFNMISDGKVLPKRMFLFKKGQLDFIFNYSIATYTAGKSIIQVTKEFYCMINYLSEGWTEKIVNLTYEGKVYKQYILSGYDQMLWMLSLGYLLDISNEDFKILVGVIDRDEVKDLLFEFIIHTKLKDRQVITEESYQEYFHIPDCYKKLREAITETDKTKAAKLVNVFVSKDWYNNHKDAGWYNSHKNKHDTYFGYWSFETAAIVKIMGLDDSSFRDCPYYPKDLI